MFKNYLPNYNDINLHNYAEIGGLKIEKKENLPTQPGIPLKHQNLISNLMSGTTHFDALLIVHDMGTGKTCTAINAIEKNLKDGLYGMKKALILNRGKAIMNNFIRELVDKCTTKYKVLNNEKLEKRLWSQFYEFETFELFAKKISKLSNKKILKDYNNTFIVVDEVHNILNDESFVYTEIYRFLHVLTSKKVLLLTGTPIKDSPTDFVPVINLILSEDQRINPQRFEQDYFDKNFNANNRLKNLLFNKVSYLKAQEPEIVIHEEGILFGDLKKLKCVTHVMSKFQTDVYFKAYKLDFSEKSGVYNNSRQASRMVFPDGSYGSVGFARYVNNKTYTFRPEMINFLHRNGTSPESILGNIQILSAKYAAIIKSILKADKKSEKSLVYDDLVRGSGLIVFSLLLNSVGFKKFKLLTSETSTTSGIENTRRKFNNDVIGKEISVIVGSKIIAEGFTFMDVLHEHIVPHWNNTETMQVIARGIRLGSHSKVLLIKPDATVKIYRHASIPLNDGKKSIDYIMTKISEEKTLKIDKIMEAIKIASISCDEFRNRNGGHCLTYIKNPNDYSNVNAIGIYSTFEYDLILNLFNVKEIWSLEEISNITGFNKKKIIIILKDIIQYKTEIKLNNGISACVVEQNNNFFLSKGITYLKDSSLSYYCTVPGPQIKEKISTRFLRASLPEFINEESETIIQRLIELAVTMKITNMTLNEKGNEILLKYKNYYSLDPARVFYSFSFNKKSKAMCFRQPIIGNPFNNWIPCPRYAIYQPKPDTSLPLETKFIERGLKYYGLINPSNDNFCIKKINFKQTKEKDLRTIASGRRCINLSKQSIIQISKELGIEKKDGSRETLCNLLKTKFQSDNALVTDPSCGVQTKRKILKII